MMRSYRHFPLDTPVEDVVETLSKTEQDALLGRFTFKTLVDQELGEERLYMSGLWKRGRLKHGEKIHTPLGIKVRDYLKKLERQSRKPEEPARD